MKNVGWVQFFLILIVFGLEGCVSPGTDYATQSAVKPSPLTHGNVQLSLKKGGTTQNEVLEKFGPPNIMTTDGDGNEVWTYQKQATVSKSTSRNSYGTVILFGGSSGSSGFEQSSKTMTLIIKFDKDKRISDFKSLTTEF